jgi:hypothetical protein
MDAFKKYKEENEKVNKKSIVTKFDKEALEAKKNEYLAIKKAKMAVMRKKMLEKMRKLKKEEGGLKKMEEETEQAYDDLKHKKDKHQEFPDDEEVEAEVEAQQTKVETIEQSVEIIIDEKPKEGEKKPTTAELDALKRLKSKAAEKQAYSQMYNEAKEIIEGEDEDEWEMYFDSIKSQFIDMEKKYKYAVLHKKKDAKQLGVEFDKMMITYKASLTVKFDLEE